MNLRGMMLVALVTMGLAAGNAWAQAWPPMSDFNYENRLTAPAPTVAPTTVYSYGPTVISGTAPAWQTPTWQTPSYAAPNVPTYTTIRYGAYPAVRYAAPMVAYRPAVPTVPVVAYRPVVAPHAVYRPMPVTTYAAPAAPAPVAVPAGPRVIVHPKVYVEGEPIRNLIKAITP